MEEKSTSAHIHGKEITFKTGKIARQANGAVLLTCGDTHILASACGNKTANPDCDFLPLRVDYQEKQSSAGRTLGGFIKREGRPTESQTLISRLIDRPIRPMFPAGYFNEVQLLIYVLSYDDNHPPEPLAITAASAALVMSDIPFPKPLAGVRVGMIGDEFIINPSLAQMKESKLDLLLAGTNDAILMIEGYCDFLTEEQVVEAIDQGHEAIKEITKTLSDWQNVAGKEKFEAELTIPEDYILEEIENKYTERLETIFAIKEKAAREAAQKEVEEEIKETYLNCDEPKCKPLAMKIAIKKSFAKILRTKVLREKKRSDGRTPMEIRPIYAETSLLPRTHGDALFTRGETQTIAVCTLGGDSMGQRYENLEGDFIRKFYLQYSFPPFSVGECGRVGPPGRREVGHGKLAERALECVLPDADTFPYTIRLESNITESNGSSSMASVCGGCLAMMDAGVPLKKSVSGIAMGLILEGNQYMILSDILGLEDALGDMDFKITGDREGISAFQMDIKIEGINKDIMKAALLQAKEGRVHILDQMDKALATSRKDLSDFAPRIESIQVKPSKIGIIVGPGGKKIRSIVEDTGCQVDINDDGVVKIISNDGPSLQKAKDIILDLIAEVEIGKTYKGAISSIVQFGAFVTLPGGKDGLCHISEICHERVENVEDYLKKGQEIEVKVLDINDHGKIKLSRKVLMPKPEATAPKA
ncbi:MAG: Polyribonucleotide nucleotidyltransferase [Chlamydiia bacterium]|nr:Polyribonucleotide nucleotidyltransferase [Chlamydiia bacterium]MCH9617950.1 Polyribonucleotide nucleotidyltransferase [Chlamydiia bacterium]MCH9623725.1 Polyribonucleotide nucleotidyltransferase [Chlamydiia bacterium]